ncbi:Hypothetical predicted protein, partial [Paramuricea clavata]
LVNKRQILGLYYHSEVGPQKQITLWHTLLLSCKDAMELNDNEKVAFLSKFFRRKTKEAQNVVFNLKGAVIMPQAMLHGHSSEQEYKLSYQFAAYLSTVSDQPGLHEVSSVSNLKILAMSDTVHCLIITMLLSFLCFDIV